MNYENKVCDSEVHLCMNLQHKCCFRLNISQVWGNKYLEITGQFILVQVYLVPYWQHHYDSKITKRSIWLILSAPYTNEGHCDVDPQSPLVGINIMSLCLTVNKAVHWLHPNQNWNNCTLCASANVCVCVCLFLVMIQPFCLWSWGRALYSLQLVCLHHKKPVYFLYTLSLCVRE